MDFRILSMRERAARKHLRAFGRQTNRRRAKKRTAGRRFCFVKCDVA